MKFVFIICFLLCNTAHANITEKVFVQSPTDTDANGEYDLISVTISRPNTDQPQPVIFQISPYSRGGNQVDFHSTDVDLLPQDQALNKSALNKTQPKIEQKYQGFARVDADSLGTGNSTGCPTVGDMNETLAAKAVIDWLNGRAIAFDSSGKEVKATWASGKVGMVGVSYNGTLPIMVAATGVEGLEAIVPIGAISNWYDYYRANGLVVNPGGYVGEDADILGKYIVRKNACKKEMDEITRTMGRETGDYTPFWQARDYLPLAKNIRAAVFIAHGQSDWNVKQKHAVQLWEALPEQTPKRMFLHVGGHVYPSDRGFRNNVDKWFDHFVKGQANDIIEKAPVRVQTLNNPTAKDQLQWPHEDTFKQEITLGTDGVKTIVDNGARKRFEEYLRSPQAASPNRLVFLSTKLEKDALFSGTPKVTLTFSVKNRRAANLTVALVQYSGSNGKIMTRGWADAQNYLNIAEGEMLEPGKKYQITFPLEPKQFQLKKGNQLGVVIGSTDYSYTLRPREGTEIEVHTGKESKIELHADQILSIL